MQVIEQGFAAIVGFVQGVVTILFNIGAWCLDAFMWCILQTIMTVFAGFLGIFKVLLVAIDCSVLITAMASNFGLIEPNMAAAITAIGIPQGVTIIGSACLIRLTINLIPSWITRV